MQRALRGLPPDRGRRRRGRARAGAAGRRAAQRPRRLARGARARLAPVDDARAGAARAPGAAAHRSRRTLVAIRVAFWLGAALTLVWAPAPDRPPDRGRLRRPRATSSSAPSPSGMPAGSSRSPSTATRRCRRPPPSSRSIPPPAHALAWVTGSTLVAGVLISLAAAAVAAWALVEIARPAARRRAAPTTRCCTSRSTRSPSSSPSLYSDGLFLALAAGSFLAASRGRAVTAGVLGGLATGTRLLGLALLPAARVPALARTRARAVARAAGSARAAPRRGRPLRALSRPDARRPVGVHERPGATGIATRRRSARSADCGTRSRRPAAARATCSTSLLTGPGQDEQVALWNVSHLVLLAAAVWLTWVAWRRLGPAFGLYSAATLAIVLSVPADGFPLVSLPRFLLARLPALPRARLADARPPAGARGDAVVVRSARRGRARPPSREESGSREAGARGGRGETSASVEHSLPQIRLAVADGHPRRRRGRRPRARRADRPRRRPARRAPSRSTCARPPRRRPSRRRSRSRGRPVPAAQPKLTRAETSVIVLNGNGRSGAAAEGADRVRAFGYTIGTVGNAPRRDVTRTVVMYRNGYRPEALRLAKDLKVKIVGPLDGLAAEGHARRAPRARPRRLASLPGVDERPSAGRAARPRPTASRPGRACRRGSGRSRRRRGRRGSTSKRPSSSHDSGFSGCSRTALVVRRRARRRISTRRLLHASPREERLERERVERPSAVGRVSGASRSPRSSAAPTSRMLRSASHGDATDAAATRQSARAPAAAKGLRTRAGSRPAAASTPTAKSAGPVTATKSHGKSTSA